MSKLGHCRPLVSVQAYTVGDYVPLIAKIVEANTTFKEELLDIRYDEESKHNSDSDEYEIYEQMIFNKCLQNLGPSL